MVEDDTKIDRQVDRLLTRYVDALDEGGKPDKAELIKQCPISFREEFIGLLEMIDILRRNRPSPSRLLEEKRRLHDLVDELAQQFKKRGSDVLERKAVSFRKKELTPEEEKIVNEEIEKIFKEEFGKTES